MENVKPGLQTSEGRIAAVTVALGVAGAVVPALWTFFTDVAASFPQVRWIALIASGLGSLVAALTALGYSKARAQVKVAALQSSGTSTSTTVTVTPPSAGFARLGLVSLLAVACLAGCAALKGASGSTGKIDLGNGWECYASTAPVNVSSCTKPLTLACQVPFPKGADGSCLELELAAPIPEIQCAWSFSPGPANGCVKAVTFDCAIPVKRAADGSCG
jgi:hypothetical protein